MIYKCSRCNSLDNISYGDFIKIGKKIIRHRKCLKCENCFKENDEKSITKSIVSREI